MISLAQLVDGSADSDGDSLAIELILAELEKRNDKM